MSINQINMLYILNLYRAVCQLNLRKTWRKTYIYGMHYTRHWGNCDEWNLAPIIKEYSLIKGIKKGREINYYKTLWYYLAVNMHRIPWECQDCQLMGDETQRCSIRIQMRRECPRKLFGGEVRLELSVFGRIIFVQSVSHV